MAGGYKTILSSFRHYAYNKSAKLTHTYTMLQATSKNTGKILTYIQTRQDLHPLTHSGHLPGVRYYPVFSLVWGWNSGVCNFFWIFSPVRCFILHHVSIPVGPSLLPWEFQLPEVHYLWVHCIFCLTERKVFIIRICMSYTLQKDEAMFVLAILRLPSRSEPYHFRQESNVPLNGNYDPPKNLIFLSLKTWHLILTLAEKIRQLIDSSFYSITMKQVLEARTLASDTSLISSHRTSFGS